MRSKKKWLIVLVEQQVKRVIQFKYVESTGGSTNQELLTHILTHFEEKLGTQIEGSNKKATATLSFPPQISKF